VVEFVDLKGFDPLANRPDNFTAHQSMTSSGSRNLGICALFFMSGALALIYEILWQRRFGLLFGSAAPATAAVLASYFAGLALGSWIMGRLSPKWNRPLKTYAILELLIAIGAMMVPFLLDWFAPLYRSLSQTWASTPSLLLASKVAMGFFAIGLPTFCMGGTLPVLAELVDAGERRIGWNAGRLYLANTLGAATGALIVPFVLLRFMGISASEWIAISGNLLIGLLAFLWDRRISPSTSSPTPSSPPAARPRSHSAPSSQGLGWALAAISGAVTLALQVLWNRAFAQVHENSMYSFSVIVGLFVMALAVGAQASRLCLARGINPRKLLGWAWLAGGALSAAGPLTFLWLTNNLSYLPASGGWGQYGVRLGLLTIAVLFLPITLLGMGLPAIMEENCRNRPEKSVSQLLGTLLAANVLGSVLGALAAGFWLPPQLGLWKSILWTSTLLLLCGLARILRQSEVGRAGKVALSMAIATGMASAFWAEKGWLRLRLVPAQRESLVQVLEGSYGIVSVVGRGDSRRLKLNNHYMLGGTLSTGDERMQTHLPLLLHPSPTNAAFLGIGTGITAGGAMFHPLNEIVAVELVPEVISAARSHFKEANAGVLESPRTTVILEDARNYLRTTSKRFDVIISDLVVPWRQGEGSLFTLEHFAAARQSLKPDGLFCQWLPLFQLSETEVNILVRTFLTAFPRAWVWRGDFSPAQPALALIGGGESFRLTFDTVEQRIRLMTPDSQNVHLSHASAVWMHFIGCIEARELPSAESRINREDRPWVEILGPLLHAGESQEELCTGRRLQRWIQNTWKDPVARSCNLSPAVGRASQAGDLMYEFSLELSEGKRDRAKQAQSRLREELTPEVYRSLFGGGE
jgi:spermidine synthase